MLKKFTALGAALMLLLALGGGASAEPKFDADGVGAALLMDAESGRILYEHEKDAAVPTAGLAKLPALLIVCEAYDEGIISDDTLVSVSDTASKIGGTTAFLSAGEQMPAVDMMKAAAMINAGDALYSLACVCAGSENAALERINSRLGELGVGAEVRDVCGRNAEFSAYDLAKIGMALIKSPAFIKFGTMYYETIGHSNGAPDTELANPNKLIKQYTGCLGVATGSSSEAGYCAVLAAARGTTSYIAVVLGAENSAKRFGLGIDLLDSGFASYRNVLVAKKGDEFGEAAVSGGIVRTVRAVAEQDVSVLLDVADARYFTDVSLHLETVPAPVAAGDELGIVRYTDKNGNLLAELKLVAGDSVEAANLLDYIRMLLRRWIEEV